MPTTLQPLPCPGPLWTALVQQVAAGDPDAIQALYAFLAGLKGYFWKHIGAEDAEDMFHDLIVVLIRQIQNGSVEDPERLPGYVFAIARRQIAAQIGLRMRSRSACNVDGVQLSDPAEDTETSLARKELRAIARRVLKAMPVQQREMLIRFYILEQLPEVIQEELGITPTQFRLIKSRVKARFAELCRTAAERKPMRKEPHHALV
jgi:RNA polymerase sigma factor (sigma-70 family)